MKYNIPEKYKKLNIMACVYKNFRFLKLFFSNQRAPISEFQPYFEYKIADGFFLGPNKINKGIVTYPTKPYKEDYEKGLHEIFYKYLVRQGGSREECEKIIDDIIAFNLRELLDVKHAVAKIKEALKIIKQTNWEKSKPPFLLYAIEINMLITGIVYFLNYDTNQTNQLLWIIIILVIYVIARLTNVIILLFHRSIEVCANLLSALIIKPYRNKGDVDTDIDLLIDYIDNIKHKTYLPTEEDWIELMSTQSGEILMEFRAIVDFIITPLFLKTRNIYETDFTIENKRKLRRDFAHEILGINLDDKVLGKGRRHTWRDYINDENSDQLQSLKKSPAIDTLIKKLKSEKDKLSK